MAGHVHCVSRAAMVLILRLQLNVGQERWESKRGDCGGGGGGGSRNKARKRGRGWRLLRRKDSVSSSEVHKPQMLCAHYLSAKTQA